MRCFQAWIRSRNDSRIRSAASTFSPSRTKEKRVGPAADLSWEAVERFAFGGFLLRSPAKRRVQPFSHLRKQCYFVQVLYYLKFESSIAGFAKVNCRGRFGLQGARTPHGT